MEAGLPNIYGVFHAHTYSDGGIDGIVGSTILNSNTHGNGGSNADYTYVRFEFNAYRSSTVYGNSDTVQPPSLAIKYLIKH